MCPKPLCRGAHQRAGSERNAARPCATQCLTQLAASPLVATVAAESHHTTQQQQHDPVHASSTHVPPFIQALPCQWCTQSPVSMQRMHVHNAHMVLMHVVQNGRPPGGRGHGRAEHRGNRWRPQRRRRTHAAALIAGETYFEPVRGGHPCPDAHQKDGSAPAEKNNSKTRCHLTARNWPDVNSAAADAG